MNDLRRLCRLFGAVEITAGGHKVRYVWDYVADEAVKAEEMPQGSDRWKASELRRAEMVQTLVRQDGEENG